MKLAAERNLNKFVFPIFSHKNRQIDRYPYPAQHRLLKFFLDQGEFGPKNLMVLDVLATYLIHVRYNVRDEIFEFKHKIPTQNDGRVKNNSRAKMTPKDIDFLKERLTLADSEGYLHREEFPPDSVLRYMDPEKQGMKKFLTIRGRDSFLRQQIPALKSYSSNEIYKMIKDTSQTKVRMSYPVRYFDGKEYKNHPFDNYSCPSRFYSLANVEVTKTTSNNHVLEREYTISFDTLLGYFFVQNCVSCYTDLLPDKFYLLSDYSQLFYRMLIRPYFKKAKIPIGITEIRNRLVLKTRDVYMIRKVVKRILDELEANSFLREWKEIKFNGQYQYSYVRNSWKEINEGNLTEESDLDSDESNFERIDYDLDMSDSHLNITTIQE